MSKFIDLTGQKFNMLVVLKRVEDKISPSGQKYVHGCVNASVEMNVLCNLLI